MRVAVVTGKFPRLSQLFILQQITGLLDLGAEIEIFASPVTDTVMHRSFQQYDLASKTHYRPEIPPAGLGRWARMLGHLRAHEPRVRLDTLRSLNCCGPHALAVSPLPGYFLPQVLAAGPFDIIHCQFGVYGRYAAAIKALGHPGKLVTTFHGFDANVFPRENGASSYRGLFRRGDIFTVNSAFLRRRLIALGCPAERIRILPMGVDVDKFTFAVPERLRGPVRIASVARLAEEKGLSYAVEAVSTLVERGYDVAYEIAGEGEFRPELEALIERHGLTEHVSLLGAQTHAQIRELYERSHLFVLPSVRTERGDEEAQGLVVQEAQASGLPVVVTDIGGVTEGMIDGQTGYACAPRDADALADALARLIDNEARWPEMARRGRELVESRYGLEQLNRELYEIYADLCA